MIDFSGGFSGIFGCTGNDEVMFRTSTDGGATFTDKINLSNSIGAESQDVEIVADASCD